jgi:hypothetical protein
MEPADDLAIQGHWVAASPDNVFAVDVTAPRSRALRGVGWIVAAMNAPFVSARTVEALKGRGVGRSARLGRVADSAASLMRCEDEAVAALVLALAPHWTKWSARGGCGARRLVGASPNRPSI